jgi:high-affinity iron transporter
MRCLFAALIIFFAGSQSRADLLDDFSALQDRWNEAILDACAGSLNDSAWPEIHAASETFARNIEHSDAKTTWTAVAGSSLPAGEDGARFAGRALARMQHVLALEMLAQARAGNAAKAQEWRALIVLPKHASAVEGALALQNMGAAQSGAVADLLAKEYVSWQATRVREKLDALKRTVAEGHANAALAAARLGEIEGLVAFPREVLGAAHAPEMTNTIAASADLLPSARAADWPGFLAGFDGWRNTVEAALPNLLSKDEVARRERLLLKMLHLVPKEYHNGVRDGEVVVPLEFREAQTFTVQAEQIVNELAASWRTNKAAAYAKSGAAVRDRLEELEQAIKAKSNPDDVEDHVKATVKLLENEFGLSLAKTGVNLVEETLLEVRTLLAQSLALAQAGKWSQADSVRLDAYTSFDTAIEPRVLPRAPALGLRTERSFLDGDEAGPGIKAALDRRMHGPELEAAYQRTLTGVNECAAMLKVAVSPATVAFTASTIVMREGLEAVVILAAILAGLRGVENRRPRKHLVAGAWCAVAGTVLTFWLSRTLIKSLVQYGEYLEAIISVLAVIILLMVTNWVFHKVYWVQWNSKLRKLTKAADAQTGRRFEWLGMVGVGFLTIYREGFETSLFLQSLILEGGVKPVAIGFGIGLAFVGTIGGAVFIIGAKLPYRKLLIITGVLVVSIMVTFLGSTVRLFQTVGWMPIDSITWLHIPSWMGLWLGLYPSWQGLLIPPLGLAYVAGAWLWTKWQAHRNDSSRTGGDGGSGGNEGGNEGGNDSDTSRTRESSPRPLEPEPEPVLVKSS